jgi:hypothetical protein
MGTDSSEAGLAPGVVGSARVIAFGASNVAPAGSVVAGLVIGDLDGGDASFAEALSERALVAMARGEWSRAEVLADQAGPGSAAWSARPGRSGIG